MSSIKNYAFGLVGLLIAMIVLMFVLNKSRNLPVVGKIAGAAQDLASDGHL